MNPPKNRQIIVYKEGNNPLINRRSSLGLSANHNIETTAKIRKKISRTIGRRIRGKGGGPGLKELE